MRMNFSDTGRYAIKTEPTLTLWSVPDAEFNKDIENCDILNDLLNKKARHVKSPC